jgi:16S rRNA (guanine966-N2)-methyltransferase
MSVKILGGAFRGFPLATPKSITTRPTSVLIKRKLFDWRQHLDDCIFVDLCAGSGAMGLEALSRGAQKIFLIDSHRSAFLTLKDNKARLESAFSLGPEMIQVSMVDAKIWVSKELSYQLPESENVVLFLDPPYEEHGLYLELLSLLKSVNFLGEIWLEADRLKGPDRDVLTGVFHSVIKTVEQGDHFVVVGKLL